LLGAFGVFGSGAACSGDDDADDDDSPEVRVPNSSSGSAGGGAPASGRNRPGGGTAVGGPITVGEGTREEFCAGDGPPVGVELGGTQPAGGKCKSGLASRIFQYGLCSCSDATFTGSFSIDAFESDEGPYQPGQTGASVGINDELHTVGVVDILGSLIIAGDALLSITSGHFFIDGNLETNSDVSAIGAGITFGRDLWVDGELTAVGVSEVAGDVYQTPDHGPPTGLSIGGQVHAQDFTVAEPCACAEDQLLDIDAIVATGLANSHNADVGLADDGLSQVGANDLDLECGRFALSDANIVGATVLKAHGRTALFIDGDLTITGSFGVDLGSEGELDVFVTGNLLLTGAGQVGSVDRPAALRFYVGGSGAIAITGSNQFAANLYAPRADVTVTGADDIYGSFFVGSYTAIGAQLMHYDASVLRTGGPDSCDDDPPDCTDDTHCDAPTVCESGRCIPLIDGPD
jgi:hypothetical protein